MIDPLISLAFAMQSNKGVYALLLGSGVSRAAQIPTGWEVVLDLVEKLAHLQGEDCGADAAAWYRESYGKEPDYSKLLDALAKTPEERQQLLRSYFEPTEDEREQGLKMPTAAHRAIASLVARGYIRVIVTTNFDRMIERAIEDEGITPTVISTRDAIKGALPLTHQQCCVIKIHGDYLDTRIKNTPTELGKYDQQTNKLLDQILDEFGCVVSGWSADWDPALRAAFERCKSRRFTLYWSARGKLGDSAARLVKGRAGTVIPVKNADDFFSKLSEKVLALEDMQRPHPLSVPAAAATVKRLLSEGRHRIRLHDLIRDETEQTLESLQPVFQSLLKRGDRTEKFATALQEFQTQTELLRTICIHGAYWGKPEHRRDFSSPIQRLACDPQAGQGGTHLSDSLRAIPSVILLYTTGIAALANDNIGMLISLLLMPTVFRSRETAHFLTSIDWKEFQQRFKTLPQHDNAYFAASEWLFQNCREPLAQVVPSDSEYDRLFDRFEIVRSLVYSEIASEGKYSSEDNWKWWPPGGRFVWKAAGLRRDSSQRVIDVLRNHSGLLDGLLTSGLFESNPEELGNAIGILEDSVSKMAQSCY